MLYDQGKLMMACHLIVSSQVEANPSGFWARTRHIYSENSKAAVWMNRWVSIPFVGSCRSSRHYFLPATGAVLDGVAVFDLPLLCQNGIAALVTA